VKALELERSTIDGVPAFFWRQEVGLPVAGLTFRVGQVDETAPIAGITHLVEHLALPGRTGGAVDCNGTVDILATGFYAAGDAVDVRAFIAATTDLLAALPLERLELERRILRAEEAIRPSGGARMALKLRYGPVGVGLTGYDDYGLLRLEEDHVRDWAAAHFTRGNAALWLAGMEPGEIELRLPDGMRGAPPPAPEALADLKTPALYAAGWNTGFCLSFIAGRSTTASIALDLLADALRDRLRHELGLSYGIDADMQPLSAGLAHFVITADVADEHAEQWLAGALDVIRTTAEGGWSEERLRRIQARGARSDINPASMAGYAAWCAEQALVGRPFESRTELAIEREAVTAEAIAEAVSAFRETLLVLAPESTPLPDGLVDYPYVSSSHVEGRRHRPAGFRARFRRGDFGLVAGEDGISLIRPDGSPVTARFETTVLCIRAGETRTLLTDDGFFLTISSGDWAGGDDVVATIDGAIPAERVAWEDLSLSRRVEGVAELAGTTFKRTWHVSEELALLPSLLEDGEALLALGAANRGWRWGLLALTDRRLRFLYGDGSKHSFVVERGPIAAKTKGSTLELLVDGEWIALSDLEPEGKAAQLAQLVEEWSRTPAT
jgi:zinc protease